MLVPLGLAAPAARVVAQARSMDEAPLVRPALERDELSRIVALLDSAAPRYATLRAPSRQFIWRNSRTTTVTLLSPELTLGVNSSLPYGFNDGPAWQGRGLHLQGIGGLAITRGPFRLIVAPQYVYSENSDFQTVPYPQGSGKDRSAWANPFHPAPSGIDLPLRFGNQPVRSLVGTVLRLRLRSSKSGSQAKTSGGAPVSERSPLGLAGCWRSLRIRSHAESGHHALRHVGWLVLNGHPAESQFFDRAPDNDRRSVGAFAAVWRPPQTTGGRVGLSRVVILADDAPLSALFAPLGSVGRLTAPTHECRQPRPNHLAVDAGPPGVGWRGPVGRFEEPASLRFLGPGPFAGLHRWTAIGRRLHSGSARRRRATYLEPSPPCLRPVGTVVSVHSRVSPCTASRWARASPGASSQWIGGDVIHLRWRWCHAARVAGRAALFTWSSPGPPRGHLLSAVCASAAPGVACLLLDWARRAG